MAELKWKELRLEVAHNWNLHKLGERRTHVSASALQMVFMAKWFEDGTLVVEHNLHDGLNAHTLLQLLASQTPSPEYRRPRAHRTSWLASLRHSHVLTSCACSHGRV